MDFIRYVSTIFLLLPLLASVVFAKVFDITKLGAKSDGQSDIAMVVTDAWKQACAFAEPSTVLIPEGNYFMGKAEFQGPCKAPIKLQNEGVITAPDESTALGNEWISFLYVDQLTVFGSGSVDGKGQLAWKANDCVTNMNCKATKNFFFHSITNSYIIGVKSINSKNFHVVMNGCKNVTFDGFVVSAPEDSPNTDGIHIGRSSGITINNTVIGTGDDCISLGDGSEQIRVYNITCGPGHGISIGSLGRSENEEPVKGVFITKAVISNTQNGVRIKSWPGLTANDASDIHFEDVQMNNVMSPIIIDQIYCPWNQCKANTASKVKISDVSFSDIKGTSASALAVKLACSSEFPCEKVTLEKINLSYNGPEGAIKSECTNVKPTIIGTIPPGC